MIHQSKSPDEAAVQILLWAVRGNYDHPSGVWCQGCSVEFDGQAILDDIREAGS